MKKIALDRVPELAQRYGAPLWIYDGAVIAKRIAQLRQFDAIRFAQKACSNIHILKLMRAHGVKVDSVSLGEVERALLAGFEPNAHDDLVFTADLLDQPTLARLAQLKIEVNAGSIDMLDQLGAVSPGHRVWLRINPGFGHGHSNKTNTGGENSKHGIWHTQIKDALAVIERRGLHLVGLHMHIGSGVDYTHLEQVCDTMVALVKEMGHDIEAISAGGGLSIPYKDGQARVDTAHYFGLWDAARREIASHLGHPVRLEIEPGRFLVAESGLLVSEVRAVKDMGSQHFVLVDAGFNDLMRPAMYGSHHEITILSNGAPALGAARPTVVGGPLCESGDVFTQHDGGVVAPRDLPPAKIGDYLVFHDTGAYGASMSSNYNSRPLLAEVLIAEDGTDKLIRRRQRIEELTALELFDE